MWGYNYAIFHLQPPGAGKSELILVKSRFIPSVILGSPERVFPTGFLSVPAGTSGSRTLAKLLAASEQIGCVGVTIQA